MREFNNTFRTLVLLSLIFTWPAFAEVLTLQKAVEQAKTYSPDLRSLRSQYESARAKTALALAPYEPTLGVIYNDMTSAFQNGNAGSTVWQVSQTIGFPGKALIFRSALSNAAEAAHAQLKAMELQVTTNVKTAYMQLAQAQQNIQLNQEQRQSFERILEIAKRRYESGAIPQVDLLNAQVSLYSNSNDVSDLTAAEQTALTQLNVLLGNPDDTSLTLETFKVTKYPFPTFDHALNKMVENRNELRAARYLVRAAEDTLKGAKYSLLPDFQLTAGMTHYNIAGASPLATAYPDVNTTYLFGAQIVVPLWFIFNERQTIVGAARDRATADANLQILLNQSRVSLKQTLESLRATAFRLENCELHLLPLSEQALRLALINYSAGKIDFQTLVDTASSRRNIRRDYFAAVVNYMTTHSTLGQLMGEEL